MIELAERKEKKKAVLKSSQYDTEMTKRAGGAGTDISNAEV